MRILKPFLCLLSLIVIIFSSCNTPPKKEIVEKSCSMKYRDLGNTGLKVSEIGIGCGCFEDKDTTFAREYITVAIDSGVNYIDIYTADPQVRGNIGYALDGRREKMIIQGHIGAFWNGTQYKRTRDVEESKQGFQDLLTLLRTDYIDVGMIHISDDLDDWNQLINSPFMDYVKSLKKENKIKHIGLSTHNPEVALAAAESGLIEVMMLSLNPAFDLLPPKASIWDSESYEGTFTKIDPIREKVYQTCAEKGIGISVMKVFGGGGRLLSAEKSPLGVALTPVQCLHYALTRPGVSVALSGADNIEQLLESLHYNHATDEEKDYNAPLSKSPKIKQGGDCTYCGHCTPCPAGIDIDKVTKLLDEAKRENPISQSIIDEYETLEHHAGECIECGACEPRCPFQVNIRENMNEAKKIFGK